MKRQRRGAKDPVTVDTRQAVMDRDRTCFIYRLDPEHVCRDRWGDEHPASDIDRLTLEHVKSELRMGVRAPSDLGHLVALCHAANVGVPTKSQRAAMREYLEAVNV